MKKETLLIICFDIKDFEKIQNIDRSKYEKIVVASDDFRVHTASQKTEDIDTVVFLQKPIPYTAVAKEVISMIDQVNDFYVKVSKEINIYESKYMVWPYHVEGGNNTQKIQDILLYIKSLNLIINEHLINKLILFNNPDYEMIKQVIIQVGKAKKIKYHLYDSLNLSFSNQKIKQFIRPFYYIFKTIRIKITNINFKKSFESDVTLVWLFSSVRKHMDNAVFINEILKKSKLNVLFFSWRVSKVNCHGIRIQPMEKYVSWTDIAISVYKNIQVLIYTKVLNNLYMKHNSFKYLGVDITKVIKPIIFYHVLVEASDSYRFEQGFNHFLKYIKLKMIVGDLGRQKIGQLIEYNIDPSISKFAFSTFMTNDNPYVEHMRREYPDVYWKNFKYFVQNEIEKNRILQQTTMTPSNVIIYGSFRINSLTSNLLTKKQTLKKMKIYKEFDYYLMFDYPVQLNGYQSEEEIVSSLLAILSIIKNRKDVALIIKPHPSANLSLMYIIKKEYPYKNIFYMDKSDDPKMGLYVSDIFITKYSTLGMEAMSLNTIVVSVQIDKTDIFKVFRKDSIYVYSAEELKRRVNTILEDLAKIKLDEKSGVLEIPCQSDKILSRTDNERRNRV